MAQIPDAKRIVAAAGTAPSRSRWRCSAALLCLVILVGGVSTNRARADEGGVSFWLPGIFGSLAAVPSQQPGWTLTAISYYTNVSASGAAAAAREFTVGRFNPTVAASLNVNLHANADLMAFNPTYFFGTPVLGGQLAVGMMGIVGRNSVGIDGTLTAMVGPFTITKPGAISSAVAGDGDLYPQMSLRWNRGVNNFMTYITGDIPVGTYDATSLANIGMGHGAIDGGAGYTYFDPAAGHEFSFVTGLTYNLTNTSTNYQNGIDWHLDWGASQFLTKQLQVGAVGYFYDQLTADSGSAPILGPVESRVIGVGPQLGMILPAGPLQAYVNLKAYSEFDGHDRPTGWNAWVTLSLSPSGAPPPPTHPVPLVTKAAGR